jgi:hypothetical protein
MILNRRGDISMMYAPAFATVAIVRHAVTVMAFLCLLIGTSVAQEGIRPPCGMPPLPSHTDSGAQPRLLVLRDAALLAWTPPPCIGWPRYKNGVVVALAGSFRYEGSGADLLQRFGAVSSLRGLRYWSVTDKLWRVLINDASATGAGEPRQRRPDFTNSELRRGAEVYFAQNDSRSSGEVIYRMRVKEADNDRIAVELENISRVRALMFTLFEPGDLKSVYFMDRGPKGIWRMYALSAAGGEYAGRSEASLINRAAAYYRHFSGTPGDQEPALAP